MKKISHLGMFLIVVVLFVVSAFLVYGQEEPTEEWVAFYREPGITESEGIALALDSSGNIFMVGSASGNCQIIIKYDTNGNEIWNAKHEIHRPNIRGIAVDLSDDVYVTSNGGIIKYDGNNGNKLWAVSEYGRALAVDFEGNVLVASYLNSDYSTKKYDGTNGNVLWEAVYNGPGNLIDLPQALTVDSSGNVYVTGSSRGIGSNQNADYATIKYSGATGNQLWIARYSGPGYQPDNPHAIVLDSLGDVCVTGNSPGSESRSDYATVKYSGTTGDQLWIARYDGPGQSLDAAYDIVVDAEGNFYVAGMSHGANMMWGYATLKYDGNTGNEIWIRRYNGDGNKNNFFSAITIDFLGNIYVTGWAYGADAGQFATLKYDAEGNELWIALYNRAGSDDDGGRDIIVDEWGNVYVTGWSLAPESQGWPDLDIATIKYSSPPEVKTEKLIGEVESLVSEGILNQSEANALIPKLDNALKSLEKEHIQPACNQMGAFLNQVNALINSGKLTLEEGESLIDAAQSVIDELCE